MFVIPRGAALAVLALCLMTTVQTVSARTSLRALVLQPRDVPAGYHFIRSAELSNAAIESLRSLTAVQIRKYGRIDGYDSEYSRQTAAGAFNVGSEVVLFRSATGASGYYRLVVGQNLRQLKRLKSVHYSSIVGLGNESIAITYASRSSPSAPLYATTIVAVRRGAYLEYLSMVDPAKRGNSATALTLARKLDAKVKRSG